MGRALLLVAVLAAAASTAGAATQRAEHVCVSGPEIRFSAADGTKLVGHAFGKGTTAVILAHQSEGDLCDWAPYARRLASKGYYVFPVDFRGYGLSQPRTGAAATRFPSDLAAATKALRKLGKKKVFLVGASMGGLASLVAGANVTPAVDRRRQRLVTGALPRHGRAQVGAAAACPRALPRCGGRRQRGLRLLARTPRRCTRHDGGDGQAARAAAGQVCTASRSWPARRARGRWSRRFSKGTEPRRRLTSRLRGVRSSPLRVRSPCRAGPPRDGGSARCVCGPGSIRRDDGSLRLPTDPAVGRA